MFQRLFGALAVGAIALVGFTAPANAETGRQVFTVVVRQSGNEADCRVVAAGPITGVGGCQVEELGDQRIVHVFLPRGDVDITPTTVSASDNFNEQACVDRFTSVVTFELTGVSGAYASASGSGTDNLTAVFWAPRTPEGCPEQPSGGIIVARLTGTVTV